MDYSKEFSVMTTNKRPSWKEYYMSIAEQVASRSTCDRKHVGAIIVVNNVIVSTGYNGAPRGLKHCDEIGHELKLMGGRESCVRTIHAEANAIIQAARSGVKIQGGSLYTTASPCYDCMKLIINAGIVEIYCKEFYPSRYGMSEDIPQLGRSLGIKFHFIHENTDADTKEEDPKEDSK